jgi:hypothetical protein
MHYSLSKFTVVWNTALPFWKLSIFKSLLGILETFLCSISALHLKNVLLQDVHQLLMLSSATLMNLKQILFPLVIFYNNCSTIHILDTNYIQLYKFPDLIISYYGSVCTTIYTEIVTLFTLFHSVVPTTCFGQEMSIFRSCTCL